MGSVGCTAQPSVSSFDRTIRITTGERTRLRDERQHQQQQQPPRYYYTNMQPAGAPRKIRRDNEFFEPFPPYYVLLSSPHRSYLTKANHVYNTFTLNRSTTLDVQAEVKEPLHGGLKQLYGERVPEPTFWIGADKVLAMEAWKVIPGTQRTFAIGQNWDWCYTVFQASDWCIIDENYRNGRPSRRRESMSSHSCTATTSPRAQGIDSRAESATKLQGQPQVLRSPSSVTSDSMHTIDPQVLADAVNGSHDSMSISAASGQQNAPRSPSINHPPFIPSLGRNSTGDNLLDHDYNAMSGMSLADASGASSSMGPSLLRVPDIGSWSGPVGRSTCMLRLEDIVLTSTDTLDLNNQDLEDRDAIAIAEAIWERTTPIVMLNVSKNRIGSEGAAALAGVLLSPSVLSGLDLFNNNIGNLGASPLFSALCQPTTELQVLDLGRNSKASRQWSPSPNSEFRELRISEK